MLVFHHILLHAIIKPSYSNGLFLSGSRELRRAANCSGPLRFGSVYSLRLTHNAAYAAMCDRTEMVVGRWHGRFIHVPILRAIRERNQVDPNGDLWMTVLESTGQPPRFE